MRYLVIFLVLIGFTGSAYASESLDIDYFSNPEFHIYKINEQRHTFFIPYSISDSQINDIIMDCPSRAMIIDIEPTKETGTLIIVMPRTLLDSRYGSNDDSFFILIDGQEIEYSEIEKNTDARVLKIPFSENSSQIEIIVAALISQSNDPLKFASCGQADPKESPFYQVLSPLKQFKSGIPNYGVLCKDGLKPLIRNVDGPPACVKGDTASELLTRWHKNLENKKQQELFKNIPEVKAFYAKYANAQTSILEDHVSYFAENPDDSLIRMNLFFDKYYVIENMELHCYYQKTHQYEVASEDIVSNLEKYDCKKPD